jgi:hypothetical protein
VSESAEWKGQTPEWDFFVSYAQPDREWAEWIAWQLEETSYRVLIQAWDMVPGSNWVHRMDRGVTGAAKTIVILSEHYVSSVYGKAEWLAAWKNDPLGEQRKLLVFRVSDCERPGLLGSVVSEDLFGLTAEMTRERLLESVRKAAAGRAKPEVEPQLPGSVSVPPAFPPEPKARRVCMAVGWDAAGGQLSVRQEVTRLLQQACADAQVTTGQVALASIGDGIAVALPGDLSGRVLGALIRTIRDLLRDRNGQPGNTGRIRLRIALAQGIVQQAAEALTGHGVSLAADLAASDELRRALGSANGCDAAFIVTGDLYREIVSDELAGLLSGDFYQVRAWRRRGSPADGWIYLPGGRTVGERLRAVGAIGVVGAAAAAAGIAAGSRHPDDGTAQDHTGTAHPDADHADHSANHYDQNGLFAHGNADDGQDYPVGDITDTGAWLHSDDEAELWHYELDDPGFPYHDDSGGYAGTGGDDMDAAGFEGRSMAKCQQTGDRPLVGRAP